MVQRGLPRLKDWLEKSTIKTAFRPSKVGGI